MRRYEGDQYAVYAVFWDGHRVLEYASSEPGFEYASSPEEAEALVSEAWQRLYERRSVGGGTMTYMPTGVVIEKRRVVKEIDDWRIHKTFNKEKVA